MSQRPTYCPFCGHTHAGDGVCPEIAARKLAGAKIERRPMPTVEPAPEPMLPAGVVRGSDLPGFDKKAYQREYMRRQRAKPKP